VFILLVAFFSLFDVCWHRQNESNNKKDKKSNTGKQRKSETQSQWQQDSDFMQKLTK